MWKNIINISMAVTIITLVVAFNGYSIANGYIPPEETNIMKFLDSDASTIGFDVKPTQAAFTNDSETCTKLILGNGAELAVAIGCAGGLDANKNPCKDKCKPPCDSGWTCIAPPYPSTGCFCHMNYVTGPVDGVDQPDVILGADGSIGCTKDTATNQCKIVERDGAQIPTGEFCPDGPCGPYEGMRCTCISGKNRLESVSSDGLAPVDDLGPSTTLPDLMMRSGGASDPAEPVDCSGCRAKCEETGKRCFRSTENSDICYCIDGAINESENNSGIPIIQ